MTDSGTELALNLLHRSHEMSPGIRAALLEQVVRALFGDSSPLLKRIPAASRNPEGSQARSLLETLEAVASADHQRRPPTGASVTPAPVSDEAILDRIPGAFLKHWFGKSLLIIVSASLALIGINVGVLTFQTTGLLAIKAKAEAAGEQASLAADKAKESTEKAVSLIERRFSDTRAMEAEAVRTATARITEQGIASLDQAQISARAVSAVQEKAGRSLAATQNRIARQEERIRLVEESLADLEKARADITRAQGQVRRYEAEAKLWHDTVEGQRQTLADTALVQTTWSILIMRGWLLVLSMLMSLVAIVLAFLAFRRRRA